MTFATFIYFLGAATFAITVPAVTFLIVDLIERSGRR